jgi:hypothetical protein
MSSGIGNDIKEVYAEVGAAFTILRTVNITGEYTHLTLNRQVTKPFIREFFLEAAVAYDTDVVAGDLIRLDVPGEVYIVMNKSPRLFENEIIQYSCVLYKCNVSGKLQRPTQVRGTDYHTTVTWSSVLTPCYGLLTEALYGHDLDTDNELGQLGLQEHELYIPSSIGIQIMDRYVVASGDYWKVETIKKRRFNNVDVASLVEDTR